MEARIHEHDNWWWAWTLAGGWPFWRFHFHLKGNEYSPDVKHLCVVAFGWSLEIRWQRSR